jgi:cytochrome c peroxidase
MADFPGSVALASLKKMGGTILTLFFVASVALAQPTPKLRALPRVPPVPRDNPITPQKIELGKELYFDTRLSRSGTVSCNSCHNVMGGGDDGRATSLSIDEKAGTRSAPTVWNSAFSTMQFWDGRAPTLEQALVGPVVDQTETGFKGHELTPQRVAVLPGYQKDFHAIFGGDNPVTLENIGKALATYLRTLVTPGSPYDRYALGDARALSEDARRGLQLAQTVGCTTCHSGPMFSGEYKKFPLVQNTPYEGKYKLGDDPGRALLTHGDADKHVFRVSTLRNVAMTAPYFHNGSATTLEEAVRVMAKAELNQDLEAQQVHDIVAFLNSLSGPFPEQKMPRLPDLAGTAFVK